MLPVALRNKIEIVESDSERQTRQAILHSNFEKLNVRKKACSMKNVRFFASHDKAVWWNRVI